MAGWSSSPSLLMMHQQQQSSSFLSQDQNQNQNHLISNDSCNFVSSNVASFVARLMSLSAHELQCLHADTELMRQLTQTHLLMENKLQVIQNRLIIQQQQQDSYYQHYYQRVLSANQHTQFTPTPTSQQLALDLRLSPSQEQQQQQQQQQQQSQRHPKKLKLSEYQQQLTILDSPTTSGESSLGSPNSQLSCTAAAEQPSPSSALPVVAQKDEQPEQKLAVDKRPAKKYKGEFDEPTPEEVERRQRLLSRSDNYHRAIGSAHLPEECACVLGSQFRANKSTSSVLSMIDRWRHLDTEQRIKSKWDVDDLPLDIPLADIKKFEDLRREASRGRADFGGASKRKPLGIRATRQFLLILYCLWGHPGRDDVMQKEGYCPHCFAKIKKANEQSTLVRVVNHFNMKHRKGANPRLSPHHHTNQPSYEISALLSPPQECNNNNNNNSDIKRKQTITPSSAPQTTTRPTITSHSKVTAQAQVSQPKPPTSTCKKIKLEPQDKQQQQQRHLFADLLLLANSSTSASPTSTTPPPPEPKAQVK